MSIPPPAPRGPRSARGVPPLVLVGLLLALAPPRPAPAQGVDAPARQVTLFGVIAVPGGTDTDPKLAKVQPQLRKLLPNHGFRLLDVRSKRLQSGATVGCNLEDNFTAAATLVQPLDENGKVQLRCAVLQNQTVLLETLVSTPPNQLFFCDKQLPNGHRLLIGIGAR